MTDYSPMEQIALTPISDHFLKVYRFTNDEFTERYFVECDDCDIAQITRADGLSTLYMLGELVDTPCNKFDVEEIKKGLGDYV